MTVETKKHGAHKAPLHEKSGLMSKLEQVVEAVEKYNQFVLNQVKRARVDEGFGREVIDRWHETKSKTPVTHTPTGLPLPRLALAQVTEPGEIERHLFGCVFQ